MNETNVKRIYADHAATTPVLPEVVEAMLPCFNETWGNPSSLHQDGQRAKELLVSARATLASTLGCDPSEVYFTSCGSESDNWAIKGAARKAKQGRNKIITSKIEHHAVLHTCEALAREGFNVVYLDVDSEGIVDLDQLRREADDTTALVAVMMANNEIGTLQPICEIAEIAHDAGALCFTDAVQAFGAIRFNVKEIGVDMLALSGHKLGAPKGIGALYIKKGVRIANLIDGGGQEKGKRGGTENLPYIVGLAKAAKLAQSRLDDVPRIIKMRNRLIDGLCALPHSKLNGARGARLPGNVNVSFEYVEGESLLLWLDIMGISASTGSACSSNSLEASHVLLATGLPIEMAHGSLRFSLSHSNTEEDVDRIIAATAEVVSKLRAMSPIYPGN
ncbi:MAG: aminotransferase class V-fold PLP-dependent enzyme [Clostridia bacterium]|nr:aminotransferase class V-fold PLP-dependent enzyme [Clostridia bacterium]